MVEFLSTWRRLWHRTVVEVKKSRQPVTKRNLCAHAGESRRRPTFSAPHLVFLLTPSQPIGVFLSFSRAQLAPKTPGLSSCSSQWLFPLAWRANSRCGVLELARFGLRRPSGPSAPNALLSTPQLPVFWFKGHPATDPDGFHVSPRGTVLPRKLQIPRRTSTAAP